MGWSFAIGCGPAHADAPLTRIRQQTRELLKHVASLEDGKPKDQSIAALCDLFVVIRSDSRYASSEMLQGDAAKVRRRLIALSQRRAAKLKRAGISRPSSLSSEVDAAIAAAIQNEESSLRDLTQPSGHGGGSALDNGWQLVELMQRVVAPDFWDRRGGPGTIRYFAMRKVLVVRATSDVHEQIKDLLMALR